MKTRLYFFLTVIGTLITTTGMAQCPTNYVTLTTQAEVDAFEDNYPDCAELIDGLRIDGSNDITDLTPLSKIEKIGGDLIINDNEVLSTLYGLHNVTSVGGKVWIYFNDGLSSLSGLNKLSSISGEFNIYGNLYMTSLSGIESLTSVGGDLLLHTNHELISVEGLKNLTSIGGELEIYNHLLLPDLTGLESIDPSTITNLIIGNNLELTICNLSNFCVYLANNGESEIEGNKEGCKDLTEVLQNCQLACPVDVTLTSQADVNFYDKAYGHCTTIEGNLNIIGTGITDLTPLDHIVSVAGNVTVYNTSVTTMSGLDQITSVGGYVYIVNNDVLSSLSGLQGLESVDGTIYIQSNDALTSLSGMDNLTSLGGDLEIYQNATLTDLSSLEKITSIAGSLKIYDNPALQSLSGLDGVTSVGTDLYIHNNDVLTSLQALQNIKAETIDLLQITDNLLLSVCDLPNICSYLASNGSSTISGNAEGCASNDEVEEKCNPSACPTGDVTLTTQAEVNEFGVNYGSCTTINGELIIGPSSDITDLSPLSNIETVTEGISIHDNSNLTSLDGLEKLTTTLEINISSNPQLSSLQALNVSSEVQALIISDCDALTSLEGLESITKCNFIKITQNSIITTLQGLHMIDPANIDFLDIRDNPNLSICDLPNICAYLDKDIPMHTLISGNAEGCASTDEVEEKCNQPDCPTGDVTLTTQAEVNEFGENYGSCSTITGRLTIGPSTDITDLSPLQNITTIINDTRITGNDILTSLDGLDKLSSINNIGIGSNPKLVSLKALAGLSVVGGYLLINFCDALTSLEGLQNLTEIVGRLEISGNAKLESLEVFEKLKKVSELNVDRNDKLTTLQGLHNIDPGSLEGLKVVNNPNLSICDLPNICVYLDNSIPFNTKIFGNAQGCASVEEVEEACLPEVKSITSPADIPAPCGSSAQELDLPSTVEVTYDDSSMGQLAVKWDLTNYSGTKGTDTLTGNLDLMEVATNPDNLTPELVVIVEAPEKPVVVCPESYIISCDPVVQFDLPVATDQCGIVRVEQTDRTGLSPGSVFPVGITRLTYQASNAAGSVNCTIEVEILPDLDIQHVSGVADDDTLHLAACLPPRISEDDLDFGAHLGHSNVTTRVFSEDAPLDTKDGLWKLLNYEYTVTNYCGGTETFRNYVALYDLSPPMYLNFPQDTTITFTDDLPPVSEDVDIIDLCRFVVWDTVTTIPLTEAESGDTIAFVRRWMAEDEVGNLSFRDQTIYVAPASAQEFGSVTAHVAKESDLIRAHFPGSAGTDGIPVTLYRIDSTARSKAPVDALESGNWQGQHGNVIFTPVQSGLYQLKIEVPQGYIPIHADTLFTEDGWSDSLFVRGNIKLDLGTILLLPAPEPAVADTILPMVQDGGPTDPPTESHTETFTLYPNPTSGRITIRTSQPGAFDFRIYNHLGQLVKKGNAAYDTEIEMHNQADGMYFIQLKRGKQDLGGKRILLMGR